MKRYSDWTTEELLHVEQTNVSAHLAMMVTYLTKHGLDVADFITYLGQQVAPIWAQQVSNASDMMNGILVNVRANGGEVKEAQLSPDQSEATVSGILDVPTLRKLNVSKAFATDFWNSFKPIAQAADLQFETKPKDGDLQITVKKGG